MLLMLPLASALAGEPLPPPLPQTQACHALGDAPGPEDFDVYERDGRLQLIVGADDRRAEQASPEAGLFAVDWPSGASRRLEVSGRDACSMRPHGVSTVQEAEGWALYVVMHYDEADLKRPGCALPQGEDGPIRHAVERFTFEGEGPALEGLAFDARLAAPAFTDPNDVDAAPDGSFVVSNNPHWGLLTLALDALLHQDPSQVWRYTPGAGWTLAQDQLLYANGVLLSGDALWVGTFRGALMGPGGAEGGLQLRGALDNLLIDDAGVRWVVGHHAPRAFFRHSRDGARPSPTLTFAVSPGGTLLGAWQTPLEVKAASSALRLQDDAGQTWMIYAQVFERGLMACPVAPLPILPALPPRGRVDSGTPPSGEAP